MQFMAVCMCVGVWPGVGVWVWGVVQQFGYMCDCSAVCVCMPLRLGVWLGCLY